MSSRLNALKAAFGDNQSDNNGDGGAGKFYRFWNMNEGDTAEVRFLPDANPDNPMGFLVEKRVHNLMINGQRRSVPCLSMYGEDCPICKVSADYYKAGDETNGKKYWRKASHIGQALIVEDPITGDDGSSLEGQVKAINISYQIFAQIKSAFADDEMEREPFAYEGGTNFLIKKTKQGDHAAYNTSKFSRKESDLTEEQIQLVEEASVDLSTLLPANPGFDKVNDMLKADMSGTAYNDGSTGTSTGGTQEPDLREKAQSAGSTPAKSTGSSNSEEPSEDDAARILAEIRNRSKSK